MRFKDRKEAGEKLAQVLEKYRGKNAVIYALPRGGVVLGAVIAQQLHLPLDLVIVRKIGHPQNPEYAICAVSEKGSLLCNHRNLYEINQDWLSNEICKEQGEAQRRHRVYLDEKEPIPAAGKVAILVDDGIATGLSMQAAIEEIKNQNPKEIVVAVPIMPRDTAEKLGIPANTVIALDKPQEFLGSVGDYYDHFPQVSDEEVIQYINS